MKKPIKIALCLLPLLLFCAIAYFLNHPIPSASTRELRQQLAGTTKVVVCINNESNRVLFTLQGSDAQAFVEALHVHNGGSPAIEMIGTNNFYFFANTKRLAKINLMDLSGAWRLVWDKGDFVLYPRSARYIKQVFADHNIRRGEPLR